jgi:hypothetical protein
MTAALSSQPPAALAARLDAAFAATTILSPSRFAVEGLGPVELRGSGTEAFVEALWPALYQAFYIGPAEAPLRLDAPLADPAFIATLQAANPTKPRWDAGWSVYQGTGGSLSIVKGETHRLALPGQYAFAQGVNRLPKVGDSVELLVVGESLTAQPGYYYVFGDTVPSDFDDALMARLYFNVTAETAPWLLQSLAALFNHWLVPFRLKCPSAPAGYERSDTLVVYLARRFVPFALSLLDPVAGELAERLRPGVPMFSKPLLPGLGAADDPGGGESFGQARCHLLARAIIATWRQGSQDPADRRAATLRAFRESGLSIAQPHLASGMVDCYTWPSDEARS